MPRSERLPQGIPQTVKGIVDLVIQGGAPDAVFSPVVRTPDRDSPFFVIISGTQQIDVALNCEEATLAAIRKELARSLASRGVAVHEPLSSAAMVALIEALWPGVPVAEAPAVTRH